MESLKFEGQFQDLSIKQVDFIRGILVKRGYTNNTVTFAPVGKIGDNYVANVKRITVAVENGDDFNMIAKIAPTEESIRSVLMADKLFNNEAVMYTDILPKYQRLQQNARVAKEDNLRFAECYGFFTEVPHEIILLEDLKESDFKMLDKLQPLTHDAVKLILKNFAILHSLSFVLKKLEPDAYDLFKGKLTDLWCLADNSKNNKMWKQVESEIVNNMLDSEDYRSAVRGMISQALIKNANATSIDNNLEYSVIIQGDGWTNNIMFRIEDETVKECVMIDYQISREANPVTDILYMVFNCTDYKTRKQYFNQWIDHYYTEFDKSLNAFGMTANVTYPRDLLDADIKKYSVIYFGIAVYLFNILLRQADEAAEVQNAMSAEDDNKSADAITILNLSAKTKAMYKKRIEELVDSCRELNLF